MVDAALQYRSSLTPVEARRTSFASNIVATASAIFMSAPTLASALGGLAGGSGVAFLGLPQVYFIPAGLAAIGLLIMSRDWDWDGQDVQVQAAHRTA